MNAALDALPQPLAAILELARWAPSGDNTQPWRFEILGDDHVVVHGFDTREHCVYDLDGSSSQIAIGALIETVAIAASRHGLAVDATRRPDSPDTAPIFDLRFERVASIVVDPLVDHIETRSVQRRALSTRPLTSSDRSAMEAAVDAGHRIVWLEGKAKRRRMAGLLFESARLRLTMPEAYLVHRDAIEWAARFSNDRVPEAAVGLDAMTARLMRWVMKSWPRVAFFNRYLAGTWAPRLQLDVLPALRCAAHFVLVSEVQPHGIDAFVAAGRATQRLWLRAAALGLQLQPELTPLIFARYSREARSFSARRHAARDAQVIARHLQEQLGGSPVGQAVFMGRIGHGKAATSRSLRLPLGDLMYDPTVGPGDQKLRRASM